MYVPRPESQTSVLPRVFSLRVIGIKESMPRALWSGVISFGLVSVPVRMFPATESKELRFHFLHKVFACDADQGGRAGFAGAAGLNAT
jgi:hypothetical protein